MFIRANEVEAPLAAVWVAATALPRVLAHLPRLLCGTAHFGCRLVSR
jgi:hypothetical protein